MSKHLKNFVVLLCLNRMENWGELAACDYIMWCVIFLQYFSEEKNYPTKRDSKRKAEISDNDSLDNIEIVKDVGKRSRKTFVPDANKKIQSADVRRTYAQLFADAFNGCDKKVLSDLLHRLCVSDCMVIYKYIGVSNPYGPMYTEVCARFGCQPSY